MEGDELVHKDSIFEDQDDSTSTPELVIADDSAFSSDEATEPAMPPPKKSRRGDKKKVELVPIGGDGSPRSKMEVYPPPDSWSWRKYGQKPIKGSPYPRGYYRCSSSKGCPARKQVERSRVDPSMLQITYSHEHNHPIPTTTHKHHRQPTPRAPPPVESSPSTSSTSTATTDTAEESVKVEHSPEEDMTNQLDQEPDNIGFYEFITDLEWFSNMGSTAMLNSPTFVGPKWVDADVTLMLPIGEEDQSLFGDLGELPECSVVFQRRCVGEQPACIAGG